MHLSITLVNDQLDAQLFYFIIRPWYNKSLIILNFLKKKMASFFTFYPKVQSSWTKDRHISPCLFIYIYIYIYIYVYLSNTMWINCILPLSNKFLPIPLFSQGWNLECNFDVCATSHTKLSDFVIHFWYCCGSRLLIVSPWWWWLQEWPQHAAEYANMWLTMFINLHLLVCHISKQGRSLRAGQSGKCSSNPEILQRFYCRLRGSCSLDTGDFFWD